jgi:hypothetical protein
MLRTLGEPTGSAKLHRHRRRRRACRATTRGSATGCSSTPSSLNVLSCSLETITRRRFTAAEFAVHGLLGTIARSVRVVDGVRRPCRPCPYARLRAINRTTSFSRPVWRGDGQVNQHRPRPQRVCPGAGPKVGRKQARFAGPARRLPQDKSAGAKWCCTPYWSQGLGCSGPRICRKMTVALNVSPLRSKVRSNLVPAGRSRNSRSACISGSVRQCEPSNL